MRRPAADDGRAVVTAPGVTGEGNNKGVLDMKT
jgi:hypothetical protein